MENVARHGAGNRSTPAHKANLTRRTTMKKKENCIDEELDRCEYKPRMAICYDFDRTLSPDDMQTFSLIPSFASTRMNSGVARTRSHTSTGWIRILPGCTS